ncbi:hypothetical protein Hypma_001235 [Hypsizygus marmoreus]|uniref:Uncharacterized protein n=1 Tax=Hypsizygus marmoreus TaxID=39966 RepID=A0A369JAJ9_HYPMA|nr:hypothetical protein Hypma_001235 [Hypsizygus marmoreus]
MGSRQTQCCIDRVVQARDKSPDKLVGAHSTSDKYELRPANANRGGCSPNAEGTSQVSNEEKERIRSPGLIPARKAARHRVICEEPPTQPQPYAVHVRGEGDPKRGVALAVALAQTYSQEQTRIRVGDASIDKRAPDRD